MACAARDRIRRYEIHSALDVGGPDDAPTRSRHQCADSDWAAVHCDNRSSRWSRQVWRHVHTLGDVYESFSRGLTDG